MVNVLSKLALLAPIATHATVIAKEGAANGDLCVKKVDQVTLQFTEKGVGGTTCKSDGTDWPTKYLQQSVLGLAMMTGPETYLTNPVIAGTPGQKGTPNDDPMIITKTSTVNTASFLGTTKTSIDRAKASETVPGTNFKYAYMMAGTYVGDLPATESAAGATYGFVGTASYFALANSHSFNKNRFFKTCTNDDCNGLENTASGDVCIEKLVNGACPATGRTINAGDYKFNLYGFSGGEGYKAFVANGKSGTAYAHIGFRTEISLNDFKTTASGNNTAMISVKGQVLTGGKNGNTEYALCSHAYNAAPPTTQVNGKNCLPKIGVQKASSITIKGIKDLTYTFPLNYNMGNMGSNDPDTSKDVHINIVPAHNSDTKFYVDYLFSAAEADMGKKNRYFVYDPDVSTGSTPKTATTGTAGGAGTTAASSSGAMGAGLSAAVMMMVGFLMM